MSRLFADVKLYLAAGFIFVAMGCFFTSQNECELTEADGKTILGINVVPIDKNNPALGDPSKAKNDKNLRGCGYVPETPTEHGNLYWMQSKSEDLQEAKRLFGIVTERLADTDNYSTENITGIGEEAKLSRFENKDSKKLEMAVRKGTNVILLTISKPQPLEIPVEEVIALARRLADKTSD